MLEMIIVLRDIDDEERICKLEMNDLPRKGDFIRLFRLKRTYQVDSVMFFVDEEKQNHTEITVFGYNKSQ